MIRDQESTTAKLHRVLPQLSAPARRDGIQPRREWPLQCQEGVDTDCVSIGICTRHYPNGLDSGCLRAGARRPGMTYSLALVTAGGDVVSAGVDARSSLDSSVAYNAYRSGMRPACHAASHHEQEQAPAGALSHETGDTPQTAPASPYSASIPLSLVSIRALPTPGPKESQK